MADSVPMQLRMSMREEVLEQTVDQDAAPAAGLILEQRASLKSRKEQGFQVFHPEAAQIWRSRAKPCDMSTSWLGMLQRTSNQNVRRQSYSRTWWTRT